VQRAPHLVSFLLLLGLATAPAAIAQDSGPTLAFAPSHPVAGETFLVIVSGRGHGCFDGSHETTFDGNEVTLTYSDHCPIFAGEVDYTYRMELTLPGGDWTVHAHNTFTDETVSRSVVPRSEPFVEPGRTAGATLLFPYFEVDPTDPDGLTTLIAVGNASGAQTLTRVVLWTDRGIPTLAFDLVLNGESVQTMNLRDVFAGNLPETPVPVLVEPHPYPGCQTPVHVPAVSPEVLRAKHSGEPVPGDRLCYSTGRNAEGIAVGYVTVDVARRCSTALPSDPEYFEGDDRIVGTRNVLWGDQFFVNGEQDFAQGFEAVVVPADLEKAEAGKTFYRKFTASGADARAMLPRRHLVRASTQGTFDGGTDFLLWIEDVRHREPRACDAGPEACPIHLEASFVAERGSDAVEGATVLSPPVSGRFAVGGPELPVTAPFTVAHLGASDPTEHCDFTGVPLGGVSLQMSASTVMKAFGRFSVGFRGVGAEGN